MKNRILFLILTTFGMATVAQTMEDSTSHAMPLADPLPLRHWTIGLQGGLARNYHQVDMSYMSEMKYDKYVDGGTYGLHVQYNPWHWIGFRAEAVFIQKSYHMDHVTYLYSNRFATQTTTINNYINIPLMLDLSLGGMVRVHLFGGGYWGYWLTSHRSGVTYPLRGDVNEFDEYVDLDQPLPYSDDGLTRFNRQEWGLVYGGSLTLTLLNRWMINVEARSHYSLTDIQNPYMRNHFPRYNTTFVIQGGVGVKL